MGRLWSFGVGVVTLYVLLNAGWLQMPHDRVGGLIVLAIALYAFWDAFGPRRRGRRRRRT